ncbi:MAG: hypothetical protein EBQ92_13285 [Proteobacteria bacterium]|nr:hypothetical protein [Pseudomonadota bacterium]
MRFKSSKKWVYLTLGGFLLSFVSSVTVAFEKDESQNQFSLNDLISFTELTKDLNRLSQHQKISFQIRGLDQKLGLVAEPQLPLSTQVKSKSKQPLLPELSTDPTQINPVDLGAFGFDSANNLKENPSGGVLPIPQARVVFPVGEQASQPRVALDAPIKNPEAAVNPDVIAGLAPQTTRFGKDRYDTNLFSPSAGTKNSGNVPAFNEAGNVQSNNGLQGALPLTSAPEDADEKKKKEQEARESFQKTMKEFAERTEEKEAFQLVDYYDLKNVLAKHESILHSFEDDEFDGRFLENAKTIFERFSDKDNADDKKPFERFLKRMQPSEIIFRSQDFRRNAFPKAQTGQAHRQRTSE